jgi:hypothetical protein
MNGQDPVGGAAVALRPALTGCVLPLDGTGF